MHWQLQFFPACTHHVFLSHCREDRGWLVNPLADAMRDRRLIPWVDQHDYPYGRTSFQALRDGILRSRHVVFLVTDAMLQQPRGWSIIELAWAELLQDNLREPGGVLQNVSLPLFFVAREDARLPRCAWFPVIDRARFHLPADGNPVLWALHQIDAFVAREVQQGLDNVAWLDGDSRSRLRLKKRAGLIERITALRPAII
ncbi:MAG TPA: toll/interleukin-1 receptor domain-containing protein [Pirellulales bacterium]